MDEVQISERASEAPTVEEKNSDMIVINFSGKHKWWKKFGFWLFVVLAFFAIGFANFTGIFCIVFWNADKPRITNIENKVIELAKNPAKSTDVGDLKETLAKSTDVEDLKKTLSSELGVVNSAFPS
mmetsp:Transcript_3856/g.5893  ORF Transcript_3856/g.5893 Transcript_3856/m.5893 type:complete len:126 (+) Transcript_3856:143-520(+)